MIPDTERGRHSSFDVIGWKREASVAEHEAAATALTGLLDLVHRAKVQLHFFVFSDTSTPLSFQSIS